MAKTSKHVQPYSPEFRTEAIRLARTSGKSHREIVRSLQTKRYSDTLAALKALITACHCRPQPSVHLPQRADAVDVLCLTCHVRAHGSHGTFYAPRHGKIAIGNLAQLSGYSLSYALGLCPPPPSPLSCHP